MRPRPGRAGKDDSTRAGGVAVKLPLFKRRSDLTDAASLIVGMNVTPQWSEDNYDNYAREGYGRNEIVFACITEIATSASEARLRVMTGEGKSKKEAANTPLGRLLARPNAKQSQFAFLEMLHTYLQIAGNAYVFKLRGSAGQVVELHLLRPDRVAVWPGNGPGGVYAYVYTLDGREYTVDPRDIGHIRRPGPFNDWYGLSPLHVLAKRVNLDNDILTFQKVFFQNAGVPSGLLNLKRKLQSQEESDKIRSAWKRQFQGVNNWHRIAILDEDASYQQMAIDFDKMSMVDISDVNEARICGVFGVPLSLVQARLGMESGSYANRASDKEDLWHDTLKPEYRRIVDELNLWLAPEFAGQGVIEADYSEVSALQDDQDKVWERIGKAFERGLLTLNEARADLGKDPISGGVSDWVRLPSNTEFVDPTQEPEPPAPVALPPGQQNPALPEPGKAWTLITTKALTPREQAQLDALTAVRTAAEPGFEAAITGHFRNLKQRVDSIIGRAMDRAGASRKEEEPVLTPLPFTAETLIPSEADASLTSALRSLWFDLIVQTWDAINTAGLIGVVPQPEGVTPPVQRILADGATRVVAINDATRDALRRALQEGVGRGYSMQQIANGVPGDGFPGIRSLVVELYKNRALTIARTETATAQNGAAAARYEASGIQFVTVMDGDQDEACAAVNGTRQTVQWLRDNPIAHPNCTRSGLPLVEGLSALSSQRTVTV